MIKSFRYLFVLGCWLLIFLACEKSVKPLQPVPQAIGSIFGIMSDPVSKLPIENAVATALKKPNG